MSRYARLAFTEGVRHVQEEKGSAPAMQRLLRGDTGEPDPLGPAEAAFIESRDGFYLATVGETGWPYVQFRGGPPGFVHVLNERTLGYAEVRGNRQYITGGNLRTNNRVSMFFMDYASQTRLKVFGHLEPRTPSDIPGIDVQLSAARTEGHPECLMIAHIEGFAWNCSQHITPRFTRDEVTRALGPLYERVAQLEQENEELKSRLEERG
ncbi:pyridoxamine 5'-phosphate oxidase family protein [Streptomyces sp. NPDC048644]|uniref:pyridoxamine 5'-phosphate oxidase family protein n=1 Tax=Streptomyces sp. NPDC048644 TaxID=3365582 RepID=UPI00371734EE